MNKDIHIVTKNLVDHLLLIFKIEEKYKITISKSESYHISIQISPGFIDKSNEVILSKREKIFEGNYYIREDELRIYGEGCLRSNNIDFYLV